MKSCQTILQLAVLFLISVSVAIFTSAPISAEPLSEQEIEDWFNDDSEQDVDDVNEGRLEFISPVTDKDILSTEGLITITDDSLKTGMVSLQQCYRNLDAVAEMDVMYSYKNMKRLQVVSSGNIADARVVGNSIQLQGVAGSAFVCITAEAQLLESTADGSYRLSYGPYYRRFLDGYYPYRVTMTIAYPQNRLGFAVITPSSRPLFELQKQPGKLFMDTWFEGVLQVDITFSAIDAEAVE
ncbi:MAG: hypothetical protein KJN89_13105 [Gammaproteobacteria bacterium]|nr:hypothetical protein [Gammaproteobacteria bacterium]